MTSDTTQCSERESISESDETGNEEGNEDWINLTQPAAFVIVISRLLYSTIATITVAYVIGVYLLGLPGPAGVFLGSEATTVTDWLTQTHAVWAGLFFASATIVMFVGFQAWMMLSWLTAYALCPSVRELFAEADRRGLNLIGDDHTSPEEAQESSTRE